MVILDSLLQRHAIILQNQPGIATGQPLPSPIVIPLGVQTKYSREATRTKPASKITKHRALALMATIAIQETSSKITFGYRGYRHAPGLKRGLGSFGRVSEKLYRQRGL
jgi:hypothetical protein